MTRRTRTFIATALTLGALLVGASPALAAATATPAPRAQQSSAAAVDVMAACSTNPPVGDGWYQPNPQTPFGTCKACTTEATFYSQGGWETHCQTKAAGVHELWIRRP